MKLNLIIDGNYILYKNVFILKKYNRIEKDIQNSLITDFNKLSKIYPFDNIYFVSDHKSKSWRKEIYKDYKANRKKDESIDWEPIFNVYENFKEKLKPKKNVKFLEGYGLEGDDIIAHIVNETNKKGESNIIVSSDADIQQLIKYNINKKYLNIQWNYKYNDERIYLPINYQLVIEKIRNESNSDLFKIDDDQYFIDWLDNTIENTTIKNIISEESLVCKMISGDLVDNIDSVLKSKAGKYDPDARGIAKAGAKKIYDLYKEVYPEEIDIDSDEFINQLSEIIMFNKKIKDDSVKDIIIKNLKFNRKMIKLDINYMPQQYQNSIRKLFNNIDNNLINYGEYDEDYFKIDKKEKEVKFAKHVNIIDDDEINIDIDDFFDID